METTGLGTEVVRTQDEIAAYIDRMEMEDPFGFTTEVLIGALEFEHARPYLKPDTTAERWAEIIADMPPWHEEATEYLTFAVDKALDHRGISANRSVLKLSAMCWLLGGPTMQEISRDVAYAQYGAPMLVHFAKLLGVDPLPARMQSEKFVRMTRGVDCTPDGCDEGCGL